MLSHSPLTLSLLFSFLHFLLFMNRKLENFENNVSIIPRLSNSIAIHFEIRKSTYSTLYVFYAYTLIKKKLSRGGESALSSSSNSNHVMFQRFAIGARTIKFLSVSTLPRCFYALKKRRTEINNKNTWPRWYRSLASLSFAEGSISMYPWEKFTPLTRTNW